MNSMFGRRAFFFLFVAGILLVHTSAHADTNATVSGLVTDLAEVRGTTEDGEDRHREDGCQPVADAPRIAGIGNAVKDLQQRPESGVVNDGGMRRWHEWLSGCWTERENSYPRS